MRTTASAQLYFLVRNLPNLSKSDNYTGAPCTFEYIVISGSTLRKCAYVKPDIISPRGVSESSYIAQGVSELDSTRCIRVELDRKASITIPLPGQELPGCQHDCWTLHQCARATPLAVKQV